MPADRPGLWRTKKHSKLWSMFQLYTYTCISVGEYLRIVQVFKCFSHGYGTHQGHKDYSGDTNRVLRRKPQHKLEVECVELSYEKLQKTTKV